MTRAFQLLAPIAILTLLRAPALADAAEDAIDGALRASAPQIEEWESCLFTFAAHVAKRNAEPAALVAKAAFSVCLGHESAVFKALVQSSRFSWWPKFVETDFYPAIRQSVEEKTAAAVMAARAQ